MGLAAFQTALCELIASPELCLMVRRDPSEFLSRYDLSERECERLRHIVWQRGMSTSCTLYRSNRVTPIFTLLHNTCVLLGSSLQAELEEYWRRTQLPNLEFKLEIQRFAHFLKQRIADGSITDPFVEEVLDFELAANELRFTPHQPSTGGADGKPTEMPGLNSPVRVVRFTHDPSEVFGALAQGTRPLDLPARESFVMLSMSDEGLRVLQVEPPTGEGDLVHSAELG